jgi:Protein phosphatase 2C
LATVITQSGTYYLQLGDGDIVAVAADGTAWFPLPADHRLAGNETTSLCLPQAWDTVRVCGDALRDAPRLIMLSTDGYANSFQSDRAFLQVGADLLPMIEQRGIEAIEESLEDWLQQTTEGGAGNDVTLVIASLSLPAGYGRTTAPVPSQLPDPKRSAVHRSGVGRPPTKPPTTPISDRGKRERFADDEQPTRAQHAGPASRPRDGSRSARSGSRRGAPPNQPSGRGVPSEPTESGPARNVAIVAAAAVAIVIAGLVVLLLPSDPDTPPQAQQTTAARSEEGTQEPPRSSGNQPADSSQSVTLLQTGGRSWLLLNGRLFVGNGDNPASYDRVCAAGEGWATMTLDGNTLHLQGPDGVGEIDVRDFERGQARQFGQCD